jgi:phage replication O-like protein O
VARALIPNSTQVPDVILDRWMAALSGAEFKVLMYVARRTYGFGKDSDRISLNQLARGIRRRDGRRLDCGTGLSRSGVKAACNALISRGILIRAANTAEGGLEPEESTYRLNLYAALPDDEGEGVGRGVARVGRKEAYPVVGQESARVGRKDAGGRPEDGPGVGRNPAPQETGQETAASGEATARREQGGAAADADLVDELVGHGVGRSVATKLAAEKPDACRRCLEYLPYARVRTTTGAWLAAAIRDEFGPPVGYIVAARDAGRRPTGPHRPGAADRDDRRAARRGALEESLARLEREDPGAFAAFEAFAAEERGRAARFAERLTGRGRGELLAAFASGSYRAEAFERWLGGEGRRYRGAVLAHGVGGEAAARGQDAPYPGPGDPGPAATDQARCSRGEGTAARRDGEVVTAGKTRR